MSPGPRNTGAPKLGDSVADIVRRVDRMDSLEMRIARIEIKLDHLASLFDKSQSKAKR
jgi:hypothetical protein